MKFDLLATLLVIGLTILTCAFTFTDSIEYFGGDLPIDASSGVYSGVYSAGKLASFDPFLTVN